jgi:hypothetical protein
MVSIRIITSGVVQALSAVKAVGEAGKQVNGPLVTLGSRLPYARPIETGMRGGRMWRRAGPALMLQRGLADAAAAAPSILGPAIVRGPAAVGAAKRKLRDLALERTRAYTPVRSGKLRDSVSELNRPGIR